jgi:hypothetical protein
MHLATIIVAIIAFHLYIFEIPKFLPQYPVLPSVPAFGFVRDAISPQMQITKIIIHNSSQFIWFQPCDMRSGSARAICRSVVLPHEFTFRILQHYPFHHFPADFGRPHSDSFWQRSGWFLLPHVLMAFPYTASPSTFPDVLRPNYRVFHPDMSISISAE